MGYAYYIIGGKERGYSVPDICNEEGCEEEINRGLAYCCGDTPYEESDSCANYFCGQHMFYTSKGQRCRTCADLVPEEDEDGLEQRIIDRQEVGLD